MLNTRYTSKDSWLSCMLDSETSDIIRGVDPDGAARTFTLDEAFVANSSHMVTGVEIRNGKVYEVDLKPGRKVDSKKISRNE